MIRALSGDGGQPRSPASSTSPPTTEPRGPRAKLAGAPGQAALARAPHVALGSALMRAALDRVARRTNSTSHSVIHSSRTPILDERWRPMKARCARACRHIRRLPSLVVRAIRRSRLSGRDAAASRCGILLACQRSPSTARAGARFALPLKARTSARLRRRSRRMCSSAVRPCLRHTKAARASARCCKWSVRYSSPSSLINGKFGKETARYSASPAVLASEKSRALTCFGTTTKAESPSSS